MVILLQNYQTKFSDGTDICIDRNECTLGTHDCHLENSCFNLLGSFLCLQTTTRSTTVTSEITTTQNTSLTTSMTTVVATTTTTTTITVTTRTISTRPVTTTSVEITTEGDQEHTDSIASTPSVKPTTFVTTTVTVTTTLKVTTTTVPENDAIDADCIWPESALTNEKWAVFQQEDFLSPESGKSSVVHRFCPEVCDWATSQCFNYSRTDNFTCVTVTNRTEL